MLKLPGISLHGRFSGALAGALGYRPCREIRECPVIRAARMRRWDGVEDESLDAVEVRLERNRDEILGRFAHVPDRHQIRALHKMPAPAGSLRPHGPARE